MSLELFLIVGLFLNVAVVIMFIGLTISLDTKLWAKLDRMVNLFIAERSEIIKKIDSILTRIEEIEKRLK